MKNLVKILTFSAVIALVAFPTFAEGTTTIQEPQKQAVTVTTIDQPLELTTNPIELTDDQMVNTNGEKAKWVEIKYKDSSHSTKMMAALKMQVHKKFGVGDGEYYMVQNKSANKWEVWYRYWVVR